MPLRRRRGRVPERFARRSDAGQPCRDRIRRQPRQVISVEAAEPMQWLLSPLQLIVESAMEAEYQSSTGAITGAQVIMRRIRG